ncbi:hypothetical protein FACS1894111_10700 [Clostridia bacterium]|nr:hypothetical protein FACS1894111_10700 [Clostridia bacterium]
MNDIQHEIQEKIKQLSGKQVFLYGARNLGDFAFRLLKHFGINPQGYILTKIGREQSKNGLSIFSIDELDTVATKDCLICLSLNEKYHSEVIAALSERGYYNIEKNFSGLHYYHYYAEILREFLLGKGVNLDEEVVQIDSCKFLNPYKREDMKSFFMEAPDLIMPAFYENYEFITEGSYEWGGVKIEADDIVIDCGANIGLFSCYAASKGAFSYAFEPIGGHLAKVLATHGKLNGNRIKHIPTALADQIGKITINLPEDDESASLVMWSGGETTECDVTTIDEFVKENKLAHVDFIKADIEGAERLMLAGAKETLKKFAPKLAICTYHLDDDPEVLERIIKTANPDYNVIHKWKKLFAWAER